jgi:hypothetical protein
MVNYGLRERHHHRTAGRREGGTRPLSAPPAATGRPDAAPGGWDMSPSRPHSGGCGEPARRAQRDHARAAQWRWRVGVAENPWTGPRAGPRRRGAGRASGRRTPAAARRARGGRSDRPAGERERRARPPSAPHGDGPAWRRPRRAGHVPLPSPSEGCSEPAAAGAAGPAGPRARSTVERAGRRSFIL